MDWQKVVSFVHCVGLSFVCSFIHQPSVSFFLLLCLKEEKWSNLIKSPPNLLHIWAPLVLWQFLCSTKKFIPFLINPVCADWAGQGRHTQDTVLYIVRLWPSNSQQASCHQWRESEERLVVVESGENFYGHSQWNILLSCKL